MSDLGIRHAWQKDNIQCLISEFATRSKKTAFNVWYRELQSVPKRTFFFKNTTFNVWSRELRGSCEAKRACQLYTPKNNFHILDVYSKTTKNTCWSFIERSENECILVGQNCLNSQFLCFHSPKQQQNTLSDFQKPCRSPDLPIKSLHKFGGAHARVISFLTNIVKLLE